jgi:hypothetical protein
MTFKNANTDVTPLFVTIRRASNAEFSPSRILTALAVAGGRPAHKGNGI